MIELYRSLYQFFEARKGLAIPRSQEFSCEQITVYVRATRRMAPGKSEWEQVIELARVDVHPDHRNKGVFSSLMQHLEAQCTQLDYAAVYVAQVHNEFLREALERRGYGRMMNPHDPHEHTYRKPNKNLIEEQPVSDSTDETLYAICDNHLNRYVTALVGPEIRTDENIDRAMLITGKRLALDVRDSLRGASSTRYGITVVMLHAPTGTPGTRVAQ